MTPTSLEAKNLKLDLDLYVQVSRFVWYSMLSPIHPKQLFAVNFIQ
jgi:hypothetical protein